MSFQIVESFEKELSRFFGSPYAVAVDCCTHAIELCLRKEKVNKIQTPKRTYISVPLLSKKLNIELEWLETEWKDYYYITPNIIDAAVLWKKNSFIPNKLMCLSFQFKKHLNLIRGGAILVDNQQDYITLKKMSFDGRVPGNDWKQQDVDIMGYHYYMPIDTAKLGLEKLPAARATPARQWRSDEYPYLPDMKVFRQ